MNPQPKPQKLDEPTTKTTKKMKPMKQEWRKMKPIVVLWSRKLFWERRAMWVESFACLFIHQYISSDCIGSDGAIELELVTRSAYNEWSKRKIAFEERVKYWCDCGRCDSWAVVIVGLLWNCWYCYRLKIILLSHLIGVLFLHFVLIEVHEQWKILAFWFLLYLF